MRLFVSFSTSFVKTDRRTAELTKLRTRLDVSSLAAP